MLYRSTSSLIISVLGLLCTLLISGPACYSEIGVRIRYPECRCAEDGANDASNVCTHDPSIDLDGWAGLRVLPIGTAVTCANLGYVTSLREGRIRLNVTTPAARATITGVVNINCDLIAQTIVINGVMILGGANEAATIENINAKTEITGVLASSTPSHNLVLTQVQYGPQCRVDVTNGTAILGTASAAAVGRDAVATITYEDGTPVTDTVWQSGAGCILKDINGNSINLTETAASTIGDKGLQIEVSFQNVTTVNWTNLSNNMAGQCTGTNLWQAEDIPLSFGENIIQIIATDGAGNSGGLPIAIARYGGGITILSPAGNISHGLSIDITGESEFRDYPAVIGVPVSPAVISGDFANCDLDENDQISINIIQPAYNAILTGTVPFVANSETGNIVVNGVDIPIGHSVGEVVMNFDNYALQTGVTARPDAEGHFVIRSLFPGSASRIEVSNATSILGFDSANVVGTDATAEVTDMFGQSISDGVWDSGLGTTLRDSFGNSIGLTDAAASTTGNLGVAFITQLADSSVLTWRNTVTNQTGACDGVKNWSAHNVPLVEGENLVTITANDEGGILGTGNLWQTNFIPCSSIGAAVKDGHTYVSLSEHSVPYGSSETPGYFYIEDANRTGGVPVFGMTAQRGEKVTVDGLLCLNNGYGSFYGMGIWAYAVTNTGDANAKPLAIGNKMLTKLDDGIRLSGLLVRVWGKVAATNALFNSFTVDDGSGSPIICQLPTSMSYNSAWQFASVTGIAEVTYSGLRVVRIRDTDDIIPL